MAQHRYTPQPPVLPTNPAEPHGNHNANHNAFDGLDEVTEIGMMLPPEAAAVNAEDQRRRASLASLSLSKGGGPQGVVIAHPSQQQYHQQQQQVPAPAVYAGAHAPHRSSKLPWVLLVLVLAGGGVYVAKERGPSTAPTAPPTAAPVVAMTPVRPAGFVASGYIAAKAPIVLAASTSGRLSQLKVDNGDRVTKGQIVAVLEDTSLRADLSLSAARLRDAQRSLQRMKAGLKADAATLSQVESAQGAVEIASAEVHVINQKIDEMKIRSPVDGTVLEILARPGETVAAAGTGIGVMRLADLSLLVAEADISEADLKGIAIGQYAEVTTDTARDKPYTARVKEISTQADRSRGTVLVRSYLDPSAGAVLKPGMAVQVKFLGDQPPPPPPAATGSDTPPATTPPATTPAAATPSDTTPVKKVETTPATAPADVAKTEAAPATETTPATPKTTPATPKTTPATPKVKPKAKVVSRPKAKKGHGGLDI